MFKKKKGCGLFILILLFSCCALFGISLIFPSDQPAEFGNESESVTSVVIPTGNLYEYADSYPWENDVYVVKLNGTTDPRPNDLEDLCKDWLFYRYKTLEAEAQGKTEKAAEYRATFLQVNRWLDEYAESDWGTMFTILEDHGFGYP
jgi:hypothetical protein